MAGKNDRGNRGRQNDDIGGDQIDVLSIGTEVRAPSQPKPLNPENIRQPRAPKPADKKGWWWGTGRRKTAVARIRLKPSEGSGATFMVVGRDPKKSKTVEQYFPEERDRTDAFSPLKATNMSGRFQVVAKCQGGGLMGQAQAIRLALARALRDYDPTLEDALRAEKMLTRDSRKVERKKYGQAGARRRFQFSKR
jgi:small subunit ribosomal protein S9